MEIKLADRIVELNNREEIMWKQRSRIMWLTVGDKNTRFFHLRASQRRRRNKISKLTRADGTIIEDEKELGEMASSFYKELYSSEGTTEMERVLETVPTKVTSMMNNELPPNLREKRSERHCFRYSR